MKNIRLINTFLQLAKLESPSGNEGLVREYIAQELEKLGISYQIDKAGNLLATSKGMGQPVLLCAHMDTVGPCENVNPQMKGKSIVSDGKTVLGADNKVAVAAILEALQLVPAANRKSVEILFTVREETDGGINYFNFNKLKSKYGIVADSETPVGTIILSSPWISDFEIIVKGKASHSSSPESGINALKIAANSLSKLKWGKIDKFTTTNVGIIEGGVATNTIPDQIVLKGEIRSFICEILKDTWAFIEETFTKEAEKLGGEVILKEFPYCEGYNFSKSDEIIQELAGIHQKLGVKPDYQSSFGGSDANALNSKGIHVVNIGEGAELIHTTKERIAIKSLEKLSEVYAEYIRAI